MDTGKPQANKTDRQRNTKKKEQRRQTDRGQTTRQTARTGGQTKRYPGSDALHIRWQSKQVAASSRLNGPQTPHFMLGY